ncbi:MAG: hypothetical protein ACP5O3_00835 [Candidatus Micrarchaeia archaeon]|jgi:hypothetical protein
MRKHSQASVELIILLAALFAFLAAFIPAINSARALANFAAVSRAQESALSRVAEAASHASVLGNGNSFSTPVFLPADNTSFFFDADSGELRMSFASSGRASNSSRALSFPVSLYNATRLPRGSFQATVSCLNGEVRVSFAQEK